MQSSERQRLSSLRDGNDQSRESVSSRGGSQSVELKYKRLDSRSAFHIGDRHLDEALTTLGRQKAEAARHSDVQDVAKERRRTHRRLENAERLVKNARDSSFGTQDRTQALQSVLEATTDGTSRGDVAREAVNAIGDAMFREDLDHKLVKQYSDILEEKQISINKTASKHKKDDTKAKWKKILDNIKITREIIKNSKTVNDEAIHRLQLIKNDIGNDNKVNSGKSFFSIVSKMVNKEIFPEYERNIDRLKSMLDQTTRNKYNKEISGQARKMYDDATYAIQDILDIVQLNSNFAVGDAVIQEARDLMLKEGAPRTLQRFAVDLDEMLPLDQRLGLGISPT